MRFPVTIRHRASKAKIYAPAAKFAYYRLAYTVAGKRRVQTFRAYSDAREAAERIVRELVHGSQAAALNATQSRDALAALERLQSFYQSTGRCVSLLAATSEFAEAFANHYRAAIRQFLLWTIRKDYLPATHRLNEADAMRPERANNSETQFYTPREFAALLENADASLRPIIAIGGLAGLRTAELLRLDWADVWRVPGHIESPLARARRGNVALWKSAPL